MAARLPSPREDGLATPILSDESEHIAIDTEDQGVAGVAQARGVLADRVQHRLQVGRRRDDHTQDLRGRRLLLQRLRDLRVGLGERLLASR